jgi:mono/diheme cytochrome c family protein
MKKLLVIFFSLVGVVLLALIGGLSYLWLAFPKVPAASTIQIQATPEVVARGKYLATHVAVCVDCHSTRDWSRYSGPLVPGTEGKGGEKFDESMGLPGFLIARNITPTKLAGWSDGEVMRAFTAGVDRLGRPLFPLMPYPEYGKMAEEDARAITAYLRTLKPIEHEVPPGRLNFPLNLLVRTMPQAPSFSVKPNPANVLEYGRYMATIAGCAECHTRQEKGKRVGEPFAGGFAFGLPTGAGVVRSANISPDRETGIGNWDKATFIGRFKATQAIPVGRRDFNTVMPWTLYAGMTDADLGAIYEFLRTVPAVKSQIERFTPAKY